MSDLKVFEYQITEFNEEEKVLKVQFNDGAWAQIPLMMPFPDTPEKIDAIVRTWTLPLELMEAKAAKADLSFVKDMVGKTRRAERFSFKQAAVDIAKEHEIKNAALGLVPIDAPLE